MIRMCHQGLMLKDKFYIAVVRPALLYRVECWAIKNTHSEDEGSRDDVNIRWRCGHTRGDMIRNEAIRGKVGVAAVEDKMKAVRLRYVQAREEEMHRCTLEEL